MYSRDLFRLIFSYTLNISDTKDILQDTFMKYYEKTFMISKDDLEIKKWLIRVAINEAKDYKKSFWKRKIININENNFSLNKMESNSKTEVYFFSTKKDIDDNSIVPQMSATFIYDDIAYELSGTQVSRNILLEILETLKY